MQKPLRKPAHLRQQTPEPHACNSLLGLFNEGRYDEAVQQAQAMTTRYPHYGFGWKVLGVARKQRGDNAAALIPMQRAAALLPGDAECQCNLGVVQQDAGQWLAAEVSYRRALAIKPDFLAAHNNLGRTLKHLGHFAQAQACFLRALQIRPDDAGAYNNLALTLQAMGLLDEAQASYRQALHLQPDLLEAHLNLGVILKERGRLGEAQASYQSALDINPDYAPAHSNLGVVLHDLGRPVEAEASYRRALAIDPLSAQVRNNLAATLRESGRLVEAAASYREAIRSKPDLAEAWLHLGHTLCDLDDLRQAAPAYQRTMALDPNRYGLDAAVYLAVLHYLNTSLEECRRLLSGSASILAQTSLADKNSSSYWAYLNKLLDWHQRACATAKANWAGPTLHVVGESHSLGTHGMLVQHRQQSMRCSAEWISGCKQWHLGNNKPNRYKPSFEAIMARLPPGSAILLLIGEIDCRHDEGIMQAWSKNPDQPLADLVYKTVDAFMSYVAAVGLRHEHRIIIAGVPCASSTVCDALAPGLAVQLTHLIRMFNDRLKMQALTAGMDFLDVHGLTDRGDGIASGAWHLDGVHLLPSAVVAAFDHHCLCTSRRAPTPVNVQTTSELLFGMNYLEGPSDGAFGEQFRADCLEQARSFGRLVSVATGFSQWLCAQSPTRLRVGLLSGDLRNGPVGRFLESLLDQINQSQFELMAYTTDHRQDDLSGRLRQHFSAWKSLVGLSDQAAASLIHGDGVHVLLDLSGHTAGNRLPVLAWKPAPVQVSWLGYCATTGMTEVDYLLADPVSAPSCDGQYFTEKLWHLPDTRLCFAVPTSGPAVAPLPALVNGFLTFGCFQNLSKVGDQVLGAWGRIFAALPQARLRLQCKQLSDSVLAQRLAQRLRQHGIGPERVRMLGQVSGLDCLAAHAEVDVLLDTFPYPGGTTTCEALWMGVPTLTLAGPSMLSRQGASLLTAAGLPLWVMTDVEQYVAKAISLAAEVTELAVLRGGLRTQLVSSALCDAQRFARNFEAALWSMWQRFSHPEPDAALLTQAVALYQQSRFVEGEALAVGLTERFPLHPFGWKVLALLLRKQNRLLESEQCYQRALTISPRDAEILSNLAVCQLEQQRYIDAIASCEAALHINPVNPSACINKGNACKALGRLESAEASYRAALALAPDHPEALFNLGSILSQRGELDTASECLRHAVAVKPDFAEAHNTLGVIFKQQKRWPEAQACYQTALVLQPGFVAARLNLGNLQREQGDLAAAEQSLRTVLGIESDNAVALLALAMVLRLQGRMSEAAGCLRQCLTRNPADVGALVEFGHVLARQGRLAEAEARCRAALAFEPDSTAAHNVLGTVLREQRRLAEAATSLERALEIDPSLVAAHNNLGTVRSDQQRCVDAETSYRAALALQPDCTQALVNLGGALMGQGRFQEAEASHRAALAADPDDAEARDSLLYALNFNAEKSADERLQEALWYGEMVARKVPRRFHQWCCVTNPARLRVGLVSGDLRSHPVGYFLEGLLRELDPKRIELIVYATDHRADPLTVRLQPRFAAWKSLMGLSDEAAAQLIHADGVHVLLDLAGHTAKNRLPVFAWKPAPVQAAWLGYFATTGVAEIDYLLADRIGVPSEQWKFFTEKIWYLPHTRLCFTPPENSPEVAALPALQNGFVTFGCFQVLTKVGPQVLTLWSRILAGMPQARLRLQCRQLADPGVRRQFDQRLRQHGIDPQRVQMHGPAERETYMCAHSEVDLILDTFPFTGGTTTCEALWMGVPTLTLAGQSLLERQGVGLLTTAGLAEWVANSEEDYVTRAMALAGDVPGLAKLRQGLRELVRTSPVFDAAGFAHEFEAALWGLWEVRFGTLGVVP